MSTTQPHPQLPTGVRRRQRKDGSTFYEATVSRPNTPDGRRQSALSRSFPSAAAATAWRTGELAARTASAVPAGGHTVRSWAAAWLPTTSHLAPATRRSYTGLLTTHVLPTLGDAALRSVRPSQLSALYTDVHRTRSHATTTRLHAAVRQLLKAATADGHIDTNPASHARLPKKTAATAARAVHAWDAATVNAFLTHVHTSDPEFHAFATLAFHTGLRRSELLALTPDDITTTGKTPALHVHHAVTLDEHKAPVHTVPKSEKSQRRVPLTPAAAAAAQAVPFTFGGDYATKNFNRLVRSYLATRKPADRPQRITLHGARHSFVSNLLAQGKPISTVSKLAGHSDVAFTANTYGHLLPGDADDAVRDLYS